MCKCRDCVDSSRKRQEFKHSPQKSDYSDVKRTKRRNKCDRKGLKHDYSVRIEVSSWRGYYECSVCSKRKYFYNWNKA